MSKRYGLVVDLDRCLGCGSCRIVCKAENGWGIGSGMRVDTIGGAHPNTPSGKYPNLSMHYLPVPCMHCGNPTCRDACPTGAIHQREDGIVLLDKEKCNGCKKECIDACPYGALTYNLEEKVARKCNLCQHRIDQGQQPFCVACCADDALFFGDINDLESKVSKLIAQKDAYVLKPEAGTAPAVHYLPAVHCPTNRDLVGTEV